MSKDASAIYQELRDLASKALGEHWAEAKALIEPELHRIAEFMTRVGEWLRAGEISEDEARAMLELRLDELAAILRALDMPGKSFLRSDELGKRLRDALRAYIFPAEAMMERPGSYPIKEKTIKEKTASKRPPREDSDREEEMRHISPEGGLGLVLEEAGREPGAGGGAAADAEPTAEAPDRSRLIRLDRLWGAKANKTLEPSADLVDCSLFAPASTVAGGEILLQAFAHIPEKSEEARTLAQEHDEAASRRGFTTLDTHIERGSTLTFDLSLSHAQVEDSPQHLRWAGRTAYVGFIARISGDAKGTLTGKLIVSQDGIPIGRIVYRIKLARTARDALPPEPSGEAAHYRKAFISYASEDRTEVLKRTQMLDRLGIAYFQDLLSLDPGDRWAREIYRNIDTADLFLLFWSSAARGSKWVRKELDYAVARKGGNDEADPEIMPVIIEGPPPPPPPAGLEHLHFNDRLVYYMKQ